MEVDKRGSKGGFLQLFDWNGKSRKKLFSSKSETPESSNSNHGKENLHTSLVARHQQVYPRNIPQNIRNHSDYYYASSSSGDSEYGTKAPGVVARLMGLDSLPTSSVNEQPLLTQFTEFHSFRNPSYLTGPSHGFQNEHDIVIFESVRNKLDGLSRNPLDSRLQKLQTRPIERFQTEVLPQKPARPISVTHHRLLSPIKSPGFIPPKNAAYIIEAASKIVEQSPRSNARGKLPSLGSSSTPVKIRDLKERMEAAHRSSMLSLSSDGYQRGKERNPIKRVKKQVRGQAQVEDGRVYNKYSEESKRLGSQQLKNKERLSSVVVPNKANSVQKRDYSSSNQRSCEKTRVRNEVKPGHVGKNLPTIQKKVENQSVPRKQSQPLRLNNQRQNCNSASDMNVENFGPSCSQTKDRKESTVITSYQNGRNNRTVNKIVVSNAITSKKTNFVIAEPGTEISSSRGSTNSKKKVSANGNTDTDNSFPKDSLLKDKLFVKRVDASEGGSNWDEADQKSSLDVVSFTFTSPIKKSSTKSRLYGMNLELDSPYVTNRESNIYNSAESSSGSNAIGGDALTVLLEQKLRELSSMVEFSKEEPSELGSFSDSAEINGSSGGVVVESLLIKHDISYHDKLLLEAESLDKKDHEESDGDERRIEFKKYLQTQPSFSGVSCDSFDDDRSSTEQGKSQPTENDVEISDTASSSSIHTPSETITSSISYVIDSKDTSSFWELHYIRDILCSGELMLEEFALGQSHKIISPNLFERLENLKLLESIKTTEERFVFERKVLFDCVSECLETRCEQLIGGSCKFWAKQTRMFERKQWLSEEIYREISSWTNEEELNMDELVEKDMSFKNGKWIDFEVEAFEEGLGIEERILSGLVGELIDDFLV